MFSPKKLLMAPQCYSLKDVVLGPENCLEFLKPFLFIALVLISTCQTWHVSGEYASMVWRAKFAVFL
jgi:hypothetical protein